MNFFMSISKKSAAMVMTAVLGLAGASSASALTIGLGQTDTFSFSGVGLGNGQGGSYKFNTSGSIGISALSATSATVNFTVTDSSTLGNGNAIVNPADVRLVSFGFGINPNVTAVSFFDSGGADGGFIGAERNNIPSLNSIEVCAFGGNSCSGGSNGGIFARASDTFQLVLTGNFSGVSMLTFDPLGVKYQTDNGSREFQCSAAGCNPIPVTTSVPEPGSMALLGLGLAAFGMARRPKSASNSRAL